MGYFQKFRVVFAVAVAALALSGCGHQPTAPRGPGSRSSVSAAAVANTVSITSSGFSPVTITVSAGTTVTWTNTDTVTHTVSSDPYPINTDLANFDSIKPLQPHQTYSFTFTKVGQWTYHDQLRPASFTGTVVVTKD